MRFELCAAAAAVEGNICRIMGVVFEARGVTFGAPESFFEARGVTFGGPGALFAHRDLTLAPHGVQSSKMTRMTDPTWAPKVLRRLSVDPPGTVFGRYGRNFGDVF